MEQPKSQLECLFDYLDQYHHVAKRHIGFSSCTQHLHTPDSERKNKKYTSINLHFHLYELTIRVSYTDWQSA